MENLLSFDTGLMVWTWITFLVVVVVLGWKAWRPMINALQKREDFIRESLAEAEEARKEAEKVARDYEEMVTKARQEAQAIVASGKETAERMKADILKESQEKAQAMISQAEAQISAERDKAILEIRGQIVDLSLMAAEKVLAKTVSKADNQRIIEDAIKEYGRS
jgi:F-type H+-transporting ATPase subunit b